jgi:prepilin-type N-terminal cleavage/methylation domain-containing protein
MRRRRGFALAELLVALVIAGIIGVALTRLVLNQARFVSMQDAMMRSRGGARAALNVLAEELRMVTTGGVIAANQDSITIRVPYAFGVSCMKGFGYTAVSLFPADSATFFGATMSGYAWRRNDGSYEFENGAAFIDNIPIISCSGIGITTLSAPGWSSRVVAVTQDLSTDTAATVYLYQNIRYAFAASTTLPGRVALWRTVLSTSTREELVAPFDTASGFSFLSGSRYDVSASPPSPLDSMRGVRVRLVAASENNPQGRSKPATFDVTVDLLFRNYGR